MIEVKEQCKKCFHFQVCANVLKQQLYIREKMLHEENPECEHFIPTADVEKVVRCKDCKHYGANIGYRPPYFNFAFCYKFHHNITRDNDFCIYGERKI